MPETLERPEGLIESQVTGGTYGDITCEWCGKEYNGREDSHGEPLGNDSISHVRFMGKEVCECCFGKIEKMVIQELPWILPWYEKLLKWRLANTQQNLATLGHVKTLSAKK